LSLVAVLVAVALTSMGAGSNATTGTGEAAAPAPPSNGAISPQDEADSLHFVIAADREMYCREFVARQKGDAPLLTASAGGKTSESWPLPAEMLRRAAESIQSKGADFSYALRSLHPTDPRDGPQTDLERQGLAFIASHPSQNYYGQEMLGGRRYFTAVYPDLPVAAARVDGQDRQPASTPQGHQVGEAMGGIVIRVPLEF
jgi:hypothetical protein